MTIQLGTLEISLLLSFIALCVVYNYRRGHQAGIAEMIEFLKDIDTVRIVYHDKQKEYQFATHPKDETIQ